MRPYSETLREMADLLEKDFYGNLLEVLEDMAHLIERMIRTYINGKTS